MAVLRTSNAYCRTYSCAASQIAIKKKSHEFSVYPGGTLADGLNTLYTSIEPDDGIIAFKSCPLPVRRVLFSLLDSRFDYGEQLFAHFIFVKIAPGWGHFLVTSSQTVDA